MDKDKLSALGKAWSQCMAAEQAARLAYEPYKARVGAADYAFGSEPGEVVPGDRTDFAQNRIAEAIFMGKEPSEADLKAVRDKDIRYREWVALKAERDRLGVLYDMAERATAKARAEYYEYLLGN